MGKKPSEQPSGSGLELDRLELPSRSSPDAVRKSAADPEQKSIFSSGTGLSGKRHLRLALTAVAATLALLVILAIYLKRQELKVSSISFKNTSVSKSFLRVGPITATIRKDEILRLSLDIGCKNNAAKERLAEKDSRLRDKIVSVITAPDTETLLKQHQYEAVRARIKEGLEKVYGESIGEIYFAELLMY